MSDDDTVQMKTQRHTIEVQRDTRLIMQYKQWRSSQVKPNGRTPGAQAVTTTVSAKPVTTPQKPVAKPVTKTRPAIKAVPLFSVTPVKPQKEKSPPSRKAGTLFDLSVTMPK